MCACVWVCMCAVYTVCSRVWGQTYAETRKHMWRPRVTIRCFPVSVSLFIEANFLAGMELTLLANLASQLASGLFRLGLLHSRNTGGAVHPPSF